ncbi:MAG: trigger factor family protein [Bacteroidia bacterium]|nr:trigger factor family protein [Bacteroidia bacterium]MDW8159576.1 trigger factor family protein [Bacteroidia bacterium]
MELTAQKDETNLVSITIFFKEEDYYQEYLKTLQEYKKIVNIPGFRKNAVPLEVIKQRFGPSILFQQLNDKCKKILDKHFSENQYSFLTQPYLYTKSIKESQIPDTNDHKFVYKFLVLPQEELNIENLFPHYQFEVNYNESEKNNYLQILAQNEGKAEFVKTLFAENPEIQYEIRAHIPIPQEISGTPKQKQHIILNTLFSPHITKLFKDKSIGHSIKTSISHIWPNLNRQDLIYLLGTRPSIIDFLLAQPELEIIIDAIIRIVPANIDRSFLDKVFKLSSSKIEEIEESIKLNFLQNKQAIINFIEDQYLKFNLFENNPFTLPKDFINDLFYANVVQSKRQISKEQYKEELYNYLLETKFNMLVSLAREKLNLPDPDEKKLYEFLLEKNKRQVLVDKDHPLFGKEELKYTIKNNDGSESFYSHEEMENQIIPQYVKQLVKDEKMKRNHISSFLKEAFLDYVKKECLQIEHKVVSYFELYNYLRSCQKVLTYTV